MKVIGPGHHGVSAIGPDGTGEYADLQLELVELEPGKKVWYATLRPPTALEAATRAAEELERKKATEFTEAMRAAMAKRITELEVALAAKDAELQAAREWSAGLEKRLLDYMDLSMRHITALSNGKIAQKDS